jgi:hypothetical protein
MTERSPAKIKRADASPASRKPAAKAAEAGEIARLKSELAAAHARVAELEKRHADAVNRIDWIIDSLHSLRD